MSTVAEEVAVIASDPYQIHLPGADIEVGIEQLRTRQLFRFLKILTNGAGPLIADIAFNSDSSSEEVTGQIVGVLLIAIPEAEDEAIDFIRSMVKPLDLIVPERSKADRQANVDKYTELYEVIDNPLPQDTIAILTQVIKNESPNLVALGKQVVALLPTASAEKPTTSTRKPSTKRTPAAS